MAWHRHTSPTNFTTQQSRSFEGICVPLRLTNYLFPEPDCQPTATELFQTPLYAAAYHICSVTSCLLLSLKYILLRTLLPVITVVVPAK